MLGLPLGNDVMLTYGTLFLQRRLDAMLARNAELAALALKLRDAEAGAAKSNAGGWHSDGNIFARPEPIIAELGRQLQPALQQISMAATQTRSPRVEFRATLYGWINVNRTGDYNNPHYHPGNTWSGVYYIRTGPEVPERPMNGRIEFIDPRTRCEVGPNLALGHGGIMRVAPEDGMLLIFPSYLEHYVHPYFGPGERITLAFNSLVQELKPLP